MKKGVCIILAALMTVLCAAAFAETFTGTAAGFGGEIAVTVEVEGGALKGVTAAGDS